MSEASSPRFFSSELKGRLLLRLQAGETVAGLAREAGVAPQLIYGWREAYRPMARPGSIAGADERRGGERRPERFLRCPDRRLRTPARPSPEAPKNWPRPRRALPSSSG
jgi:transposase-like protein